MTTSRLTTATATSRRVWRVVAIVWIFIIAGPAVGTLFFMLATALLGMGKGADFAGLTWIALFALIYGLPFGYFIGIWPAVATGLAIGIRQVYFGGASAWFAVLAAILVSVGSLLATGQSILMKTGDETSFPAYSALVITTCIVSTLLCWTIVRGWVRSTQGAEAAV
jgi:hypothetical protein